jgi:hypothetical protein
LLASSDVPVLSCAPVRPAVSVVITAVEVPGKLLWLASLLLLKPLLLLTFLPLLVFPWHVPGIVHILAVACTLFPLDLGNPAVLCVP